MEIYLQGSVLCFLKVVSMPGDRQGWIELIGWYNPMTKEQKIDEERLNYWTGVGAQMSDRVKKITGK